MTIEQNPSAGKIRKAWPGYGPMHRLPDGTPIKDKLAAYSERADNGCLEWKRQIDAAGYGVVYHDGRCRFAHVAAWECEHGPKPPRTACRQSCGNRKCIDLSHLELLSQREATLRGKGPTAVNSRKTHCKRGHALTGANLKRRDGQRQCVSCERWRSAQRIR